MHPGSQGESSSGTSVQPIKRRKSRPRKDPNLNDSTPLVPPSFEGPREYSKTADSTVGIDYIVGQAVSDVVESTFDGGCILSIKIGDSSKNSIGVVFQPGHYHVATEIDVAPRVQMIRSNDVHPLPERSQGLSRGQRRATETSSTVPARCKSMPYMAPSVPRGSGRGTVTPVILQPVNFSNSLLGFGQPPSDASETENVMAFGDPDLHMDEPISMLPPGQSIPFLSNQTNLRLSSKVGSEKNYSGCSNDGAETSRSDEGTPKVSTYIDTTSSSQMLGFEFRNSKEVLKSLAGDSRISLTPEIQNNNDPFLSDSLQTISGTNALFNFGTGRMTKLLPVRRSTQAVQENVNENLVQIAENTSGSEVEFHKTRATEMDPKE